MADVLEIGAIIDLEPLLPGLDKMASSISEATTASKASMDNLASGTTTAANIMAEGLKKQGFSATDAALAMQSLGFSAGEIAQGMGTAAAALDETGDAADRVTRSITDARVAAQGLFTELGVRVPRALTTFIARSELIGPVLNAAFGVVAIGAFIEVLTQVPGLIDKAIAGLTGWDKEAQQAYERIVDENRKAIVENARLKESINEAALVGKEGPGKIAISYQLLQEKIKDTALISSSFQQSVARDQAQIDKLKPKLGFWDGLQANVVLLKPLTDWVSGTDAKVKELKTDMAGLDPVIKELQKEIQIAPAKTAILGAESTTGQQKESLDIERSKAQSEKTIGDARISYAESLARQMFEAGTISYDAEIAALTNAENRKFEIERAYLERRKNLLSQQQVETGDDKAPEIASAQGEIEALDIKHQQKLSEIENSAQVERRQKSDSFQATVISGQRTVDDAQVSLEQQFAREQFESKKISIDQETALLAQAENDRYDAERAAQGRELAIAKELPEKNRDEIEKLNAGIESNEIIHQAKLEEIAGQGERDRNKIIEKAELDQERARIDGAERVMQLEISTVRSSSDEQIKELERLAQYDAITFNQKIAMTRAIVETEKERELAAERVAIAEAQGEVAGSRTDEQREAALKRLTALQQEYLKTLQRVAQQEIQISDQVANKQIQDAQRAANVISTSFEGAFDKMLTQHTNFLNQATKFWDQMVEGWAKLGIQILANYVQTLAQIVLREILTQAQITTVQQSQITLREATQNIWQTFLNTLGIKTTTQATTTETQETAAHTTGVAARKVADTTAQAQTVLLQTQQLTQFTTNETAETTAHSVGVAARQAADTTGYAATAAQNVAIITSEAGVAGAAAFASAMVALPFPANIPAATAAMAAAIATTLSNLGLGAAEKGALLDSDRLVAAHANELILPSKISSGLQNAISTGTFAPPAALTQHFAAASGASSNSASTSTTTTNNKHVHMNGDIQVIQQGGKMDTSEISSKVKQALKRGML